MDFNDSILLLESRISKILPDFKMVDFNDILLFESLVAIILS